MKGYYYVDKSLELMIIPWVLYAYQKDGKFSFVYDVNILENYIIHCERSRELFNKSEYSEIEIPDKKIKNFVDMCYNSCSFNQIENEAQQIISYCMEKLKSS